jgi:transposase InsO family protein
MSKARLVITAVVLEGRSPSEVSATYGVSRSWIYELLARHRAEGDDALEPRSRRPRTNPRATPPHVIDRILALRDELDAAGLDAGAHTLAWHLREHEAITVSVSTIWRTLRRAGRIEPQPQKRPRNSYHRFEAALPNETWQTDFTHVRLADGTDTEVLTFLDDHSRYVLTCTAQRAVTTPKVIAAFRQAVAAHGIPASVLSDNGLVFTARHRGGRNKFENELQRLNIAQKNSRPSHPQTCGKVERVQQTLKKWLASRPPATTIAELQTLLDTWAAHYNTARPHRSLAGRTPAQAYQARPKATPTRSNHTSHDRLRYDQIDKTGSVTLRHDSRLHHIGIGRAHAGTRVIMLIHDLNIRVVDALTGELLRALTLDPTRDYQPQNTRTPRTRRSEVSSMS